MAKRRANAREGVRRTEEEEMIARYGPEYAEEVMTGPKVNRAPAVSRPPVRPVEKRLVTATDPTGPFEAQPLTTAIGRRVLDLYVPVLQSLRERCRTKVAEAGLELTNGPNVLGIRYTVSSPPDLTQDRFTAIEESTKFQAMRAFCERPITFGGSVKIEPTARRVFIDYSLNVRGAPTEVREGFFAERALVREFGHTGRIHQYVGPARVRLLSATGFPEDIQAFQASTSELISEMDGTWIGLDSLSQVPQNDVP